LIPESRIITDVVRAVCCEKKGLLVKVGLAKARIKVNITRVRRRINK
jgi:hypothetical protein